MERDTDGASTLPTARDARVELLARLRSESFRQGTFTHASGRQSDFFIDCKATVLTARGHLLVGRAMLQQLESLPPCDAVAGVALGGCPLASAVSLVSGLCGRPLPALYVRKEAKDHGTRKLVEGDGLLGGARRVVLLEDVVTTGGSTLRAVEALRSIGADVAGIVVLVDRCEGAAAALDAARLRWVSLFTRSDFIPQQA